MSAINRLWEWSFAIAGAVLSSAVHAAVDLPHLFTDGAVLQRDEPIPVWGWATPLAEVSVSLGGQSQTVKSDSQGRWQVQFAPLPAGRSLRLTVSEDDDEKRIENILTGDVWLCSGQSNMEWPLRNAFGYEGVLQRAPMEKLRYFNVPRSWAAEPSERLSGGHWKVATADTVGDFSAVAFYFAEEIFRQTGVPVGLLCSTWGGSNIESWMSSASRGEHAQDTADRIDARIAERSEDVRAVRQRLARWPGSVSETYREADADWSTARLDTRDWFSVNAPGLWESQGLEGVDGVVWYRRLFSLTAGEAEQGITLGLARIDDNDITWVNGVRVGATEGYDRVREYAVPAEAVHAGLNSIAIRVEDTGGGGGIYSDEDLLYLRSVGGRESLSGGWQLKADKVTISPLEEMNHVPGALYNKMIHPLFQLPVKGVIWYQGESNAGSVQQARNYAAQFKALIRDWRASWRRSDLPFYWVQLASFDSGLDSESDSPWAVLRASQTEALALPETGQALAIDVGDAGDIHPRDKQTVGQRLARIALHEVYGNKDVHYLGPSLQSVVFEYDSLILSFTAPEGLTTREGGTRVTGLEVQFRGDTGFRPMDGEIKEGRVVLSLADSSRPVSVRYAWKDNPEEANLIDRSGLPAAPFSVGLGGIGAGGN